MSYGDTLCITYALDTFLQAGLVLELHFDASDDAFMVKQLVENTNISGVVEYSSEFFANE